MKRHLIQSFAILLLLTISCDSNEILKKAINENISRIDPKDEPQLIEKLNLIFGTDESNKRTTSDKNRIDLKTAIKVIDVKGNKVSYSFGFKDHRSLYFKNFIITESNGSLKGYILHYSLDKNWIKQSKFRLNDFSGTVVGVSLKGDTISYADIVKGKAFPKSTISKTNGRVQGGLPLIPDNSGCYELVYSSATGSYFWLDVVCGQGGGSGGSPTGSGGTPSAGGYDPNSPYTGGSNDPTTGGNGNPTGGGGSSSTGSGASIGVIVDVNVISRILELDGLLLQNPTVLLGIPCLQLPKWQTLTQHKPNQAVLDKLNAIKSKYALSDVAWQSIENASGDVVNLDYFPVTITTLPNNPTTGQRFTAPEFLNYIRTHMNDFVDSSITGFSPSTITGFNETQVWNSSNPIGGVIHLNIGGGAGDGTVICTQYNSSDWIFSTIEVPYRPFTQGYDGQHPVSGNRQFGFTQNTDGSYTFYTRGVDRITDAVDAYVANNILADPFQNPDALWDSFKNGIYSFTQAHSGIAKAPSSVDNSIYRPDWNKVNQVLQGQRPISDLGCN
jgi:hypothetical protein